MPLLPAEPLVDELLLEDVPLPADELLEVAAAAGVDADAVGILSTVPIGTEFGSLMLFAATSAAVVSPFEFAIPESVSPAFTVYVPGVDALELLLLPVLVEGEPELELAAEAVLVAEVAAGVATPAGSVEIADAGVPVPVAPAVAVAVPVPVAVGLAVLEPVGDAIAVKVGNVVGNAADVGNGFGACPVVVQARAKASGAASSSGRTRA